jgi:hypothetical protein
MKTNNQTKRRRLTLDAELLTLIERDAERCCRTVNNHIAAILTAVFQDVDVSLHLNAPRPTLRLIASQDAAPVNRKNVEAKRRFRLIKCGD